MYRDTIDKDIERGFIRKLESLEIPTTEWILPQHGVCCHIEVNFAEYLTPSQNVKERVSMRCSSQVSTFSQTLLGSFYAFVRRSSQSPPTSKACTCKFRSAHKIETFFVSSGELMIPKCTNTSALSLEQNACLRVLITLFRLAPKTTHLTTRLFSASFTNISIWTTSTYLPTPSQKPSGTWKIYAVCYKKGFQPH